MLRVTHELFLSEYFYTEIRINARSTEIKHKLLIILIKNNHMDSVIEMINSFNVLVYGVHFPTISFNPFC